MRDLVRLRARYDGSRESILLITEKIKTLSGWESFPAGVEFVHSFCLKNMSSDVLPACDVFFENLRKKIYHYNQKYNEPLLESKNKQKSIFVNRPENPAYEVSADISVWVTRYYLTRNEFSFLKKNAVDVKKQLTTEQKLYCVTTDVFQELAGMENRPIFLDGFFRQWQKHCSYDLFSGSSQKKKMDSVFNPNLLHYQDFIYAMQLTNALSQREAALFRKGTWLLDQYLFKELNYLLHQQPLSIKQNSPVYFYLSAALMNPYSGVSPYARAGTFKDMAQWLGKLTKKLDELRNAKRNQTSVVFLLSAHFHLLSGDIHFMRGHYAVAADHYEKALIFNAHWPQVEQRLHHALLILNDEKRVHSFYRRYPHWTHTANRFGFYSDRDKEKKVSKIVFPAQKIALRVFRSLIEHPYLRNFFPSSISLDFQAGERVVVEFRNGRNVLILGNAFLQSLAVDVTNRKFAEGVELDSILAVIIGHELHHIAAGHGRFLSDIRSHPNNYLFSATQSSVEYREIARSDLWQKEFAADEMGVFYAFLAGYRAQAMLSLLYRWYELEPVQPILAEGHPPYLLRLRSLEKRMKLLEQVALSFQQAEKILANFQKQNAPSKGWAFWDKKLSEARKHLYQVRAVIPDYPQVEINLSYITLSRVLLRFPVPEFPLYPMRLSGEVFYQTTRSEELYGLAGSVNLTILEHVRKKHLVRVRPNLALPIHEKDWIGSALVDLQRRAVSYIARYPQDIQMRNNLALAYLLDVMVYVRTNTVESSSVRAKLSQKLTRAEYLLKQALMDKEEPNLRIHAIAVKIKQAQLGREMKNRTRQEIQALSLGKELHRYPQLVAQGVSFMLAYMELVDFFLWEEYAGDFLSSVPHSGMRKEWDKKYKQLLGELKQHQSFLVRQSLWHRELGQIISRLETSYLQNTTP